MIRSTIRTAVALGITAAAGSLAFAQEGNTTFFGGEHIIAVGNSPIFSGFAPDTQAATSRMFNDGATGGDASATDNVWTRVLTNSTLSGDPLAVSPWKMGTWDGTNASSNWSHESPSGGNNFYPTNEASVTFKWRDPNGSAGDGYLPDNNYVWTEPNNIAARMQAASSFNIWGNFGAELGAPGDWGATGTGALSLTRNSATSEWEVVLSGWQSIGNKEFKPVLNGAWADGNEFGNNGFGGGNASFFLLNKNDVITFKIREADGRFKFEGLTPLPTTDGIYALGPWTVDPENDSVMGTTPDGYQISAFVPAAGTHKITVFEIAGGSLGRLWPAQGAFPITTTTSNQLVRLNLHMTSMGDGATPDAEFIYSDPDSRPRFTTAANGRIQLVGMLGMWGTRYSGSGSDWENPASDLVGTNHPVGTQVGGDTFLYRWDAPTTNHGTASPGLNKAYKAVGLSDDIATTSPWDIQIGGDHTIGGGRKAGLTVLGDNQNPTYDFLDNTDYSFFIDTAVGRVKVQLATDPVPNLRPALADQTAGSSVDAWTAYR